MGFTDGAFFVVFVNFCGLCFFLLILLVLCIAKVGCDYMVWILNRSLWCGLLSFSFRAFLSDFDLRPFWWVPSLLRSILVTLRHIYFLQCSSFGEVDFIDLETRF